MDFTNKRIWITGASSGIGEALCYELSKHQAQLVLSSRTEANLLRVARHCSYPDSHIVLPLDISRCAELGEKMEIVVQKIGGVDILINAAGVSQRSLTKDTPLALDRRIMEINFFGTVAMTKAVLPHMLEKRSGHIVTITSVVGKFGAPLRSAYAASKHALHGFMDSLRAETWSDGIVVTLICPGFVNTLASVNALTADGTPHSIMDETHARGVPPPKCARKIVKAIEKRKHEAYICGKEVLGIYLNRFTPSLLSHIVRMPKHQDSN